MKRFGFTLAEVLVALAIVGVLSAVAAPAIGNLLPDKKKVAVLRLNKVISEINEDLLNDKALYYRDGDDGSETINCIGLNCVQQPLRPPYDDEEDESIVDAFTGANKYPSLLAEQLKGVNAWAEAGRSEFQSMEGMFWEIEYIGPLNSSAIEEEMATISIDIDGRNRGNNCSYRTCNEPDTFEFFVNSQGRLSGRDTLTQAYLENPDRLNNRKEDYKRARILRDGA